ncbi:MAG: LytR C-terminal domain-containing protein [Jiangellaceae bacterium]
MALQPDLGEGARPPADRRHSRTALTLLVLAGSVFLAGWYAWNSLTSPDDESDATAPPVCQPAAPTDAPAPADVRLNVYNATDRNGLASATAGAMRERGFAILDVANDPLDKEVTASAEVRASEDTQAVASLVMAQVAGAVFVPDERTDGTVDLVVGEAFTELAAPGAAPAPVPGATGTAAPLPPC